MQPNTSYDESLVLYHLSSGSTYYTIFCNSVVTGGVLRVSGDTWFLLPEIGEEIHFQRICQFCRGFEREVDIAGEDLGYVRPRTLSIDLYKFISGLYERTENICREKLRVPA